MVSYWFDRRSRALSGLGGCENTRVTGCLEGTIIVLVLSGPFPLLMLTPTLFFNTTSFKEITILQTLLNLRFSIELAQDTDALT